MMTDKTSFSNDFYQQFLNPGAEYGPAPFWFWNDTMTPDQVSEQVRMMAQQKLGGFFIHARMGRVTPYMGSEWMAAIRAAVETAASHGLRAWLYDEDNWPSGYGGGAICEMGENYLQKYLFMQWVSVDQAKLTDGLRFSDPIVVVYLVSEASSGRFYQLPQECWHDHRLLPEKLSADLQSLLQEPTTQLLVCTRQVHDQTRYFCPECSVDGYVDTLNAQVTDAFLEKVYDTYQQEVGQHFGSTVPGFFIDEPNYHELAWGSNQLRFPWTEQLPEKYNQISGRSWWEDLPCLACETSLTPAVRQDYYRTVSQLFSENFTGRIAQWCQSHNLELTGHLILEESLHDAVQTIGNAMEHYPFLQVPGIDHLGKEIELKVWWSASQLLVKQVESVTRQMGRSHIMVETFAGAGWDFGPAQIRWQGDWLYAFGVNLLCPHAFHYSLRGYRKRDYPPSFFYQQPWWQQSAPLWQHFTRLGWVLSQGQSMVHVGVVHPFNTIRSQHAPAQTPRPADETTQALKSLTATLIANHCDFDFLDEELLARHGKTSAGTLHMGAGAYQVIVLPFMETIRDTTLNMLHEFVATGGMLLVTGQGPNHLNGVQNSAVSALCDQGVPIGQWDSPTYQACLLESIWSVVPSVVQVLECDRDEQYLVSRHRRTDDEDIFFFTVACKHTISAVVAFPHLKTLPEVWDTITGSRTPTGWLSSEGIPTVSITVGPTRSMLLIFRHASQPSQENAEPHKAVSDYHRDLGQPIAYQLSQPNVLIGDCCRVRVAEQNWSDLMPVLRLKSYLEHQELSLGAAVRVAFDFHAQELPLESACELWVETPDLFQAEFNGQPVNMASIKTTGPDHSLSHIPLPNALRVGVNRIELICEWSPSLELEPMYLAGQFGVWASDPPEGHEALDPSRWAAVNTSYAGGTETVERVTLPGQEEPDPTIFTLSQPMALGWSLGLLPDNLTIGSWVLQGLPFYAGEVTYQFNLTCAEPPTGQERLSLKWFRQTVEVTVNGTSCGVLLFNDQTCPVGHALISGENQVMLKVANSLRNFYGPHHIETEDHIDCIGPHDFFNPGFYDPQYFLKPAGLMGVVSIEER